jgi:hypothetical protein
MKEVPGHQEIMEKPRQQRIAANTSKPHANPWEREWKPKMPSQGKPDGPSDGMAILATR